MTAPAIPQRSQYASKLHQVLDFQHRVTAVMLATTRPITRDPRGPMFSRVELDEMDKVMELGYAPEAYAAILVERDRAAVAA